MNITTNIQKIKYLRLLTESLKGGWEFGDYITCPCGHLAQIVTGLSEDDLLEKIDNEPKFEGYWADSLKICKVTRRPFVEVVEQIFNAGFTAKEIRKLEKYARKVEDGIKSDLLLFIHQWRNTIIQQTEDMIAGLDAELKVEVLLTELKTEKEFV